MKRDVEFKYVKVCKTTPFVVLSLTYYLELHNARTSYYIIHFLPTKCKYTP